MSPAPAHRRTVLRAAVTTATVALAAGCGDGGGDAPAATASPAPPSGPAARPPTGSESASVPASPSAPPPTAGELARTTDIPSGGGTVFKDRKVVVTQPEEGEFKAFSAVCTHQGCTVATVENGTINCACHGSRFRIADGSVARGPATRPLPAEEITVTGDSIRLT
ncbi:Rieske (2Fe-2S) protein [Streptomyces gobitricini]|uniref:Cytochrome bc1 complex Rieske iron-sulfur subunit n=1 Tax=Streptomyces gobitricini TaxID=68211 RepID=A0ABN3N123_9ACTN